MSTRARLPVLATVAEAFTFAFRKLPSLFILTFVAAVIAEPLTFLSLQFTDSFEAFSSLARSGMTDVGTVPLFPKAALGLVIVLLGALLFLAPVAVPIIRHISHRERLWLIRINSGTPLYILSQLPVILILATIAVIGLRGFDAWTLVLLAPA